VPKYTKNFHADEVDNQNVPESNEQKDTEPKQPKFVPPKGGVGGGMGMGGVLAEMNQGKFNLKKTESSGSNANLTKKEEQAHDFRSLLKKNNN